MSVFPDPAAGGLVTRTVDGTPTNPPNVLNSFVPPAPYVMSCAMTALPSDCTAKIEARQINALVSEMVSFSQFLDPNGPWNCNVMNNIAMSFSAWYASIYGQPGGVATLDGSGKIPFSQLPALGIVDEVQEFVNVASFPATGTPGVIYIDTTSKKIWHYDSSYRELSPSTDRVAKAGDTMTGILTLSGPPVGGNDAATKQYVLDTLSVATGGTVVEAPNDGFLYGRRNRGWEQAVMRSGDTVGGNLAVQGGAFTVASAGGAMQAQIQVNGIAEFAQVIIKPKTPSADVALLMTRQGGTEGAMLWYQESTGLLQCRVQASAEVWTFNAAGRFSVQTIEYGHQSNFYSGIAGNTRVHQFATAYRFSLDMLTGDMTYWGASGAHWISTQSGNFSTYGQLTAPTVTIQGAPRSVDSSLYFVRADGSADGHIWFENSTQLLKFNCLGSGAFWLNSSGRVSFASAQFANASDFFAGVGAGNTRVYQLSTSFKLSLDMTTGDVSMLGPFGAHWKSTAAGAFITYGQGQFPTVFIQGSMRGIESNLTFINSGGGEDAKVWYDAPTTSVRMRVGASGSHFGVNNAGRADCLSMQFNHEAAYFIGMEGANRVFQWQAPFRFLFDTTLGDLLYMGPGGVNARFNQGGNFTILGDAWKPGGGMWQDTSDSRIKEFVKDYRHGLDEICALRPVTYHWSAETKRDVDKENIGLLAQEAERIMPELVESGVYSVGDITFDDMRTLDPSPLVFALINAVKELAAKNAELTKRIAALEGK